MSVVFVRFNADVNYAEKFYRNFPITDFMKIRSTVPFLFQAHRLNIRGKKQFYEALRRDSSHLVKPAFLLSALVFGLP